MLMIILRKNWDTFMLIYRTREAWIIFSRIKPRLLPLILLFVFLVSCNPYGQNTRFLYELDGYPAYHPIWSPTGKQLAFSSLSGSLNKSAIYILDVETQKVQVLMKEEYGTIRAESWTPDGTKLVFYSNSSKELKDGIWITDVSGLHASFFLSAISVAWSPTNQLAISRKENNGLLSISIKDLNTNNETMLFHESAVAIGSLAWSTDATKLVFTLDHG